MRDYNPVIQLFELDRKFNKTKNKEQELRAIFVEQLTVLNIELSWMNIPCVHCPSLWLISYQGGKDEPEVKTEVCMAAWKPATCSQQLMCVEYPHNTNWTQPFVCTYGFQGGSSKPSSVVTVKQVLPEVLQLLHLRILWSLNRNPPVATQLEHISLSHSHCLGFMIRINDCFL